MKAQDGVTYALIENQAVAMIFTKEDLPYWNEEDLEVVAVPNERLGVDIGVGSVYKDGEFSYPSMEKAKQDQLFYINNNFETDMYLLGEETLPQEERLSWDTQYSEAKAYKASQSEADCPFLAELAKARGENLDDLVEKIITKNQTYKAQSAKLIGYRQSLAKALEEATTYDEIKAIKYISPLGTDFAQYLEKE